MGWFTGLARGFSKAHDDYRAEERQRADNQLALERQVFTTLLQSPEPKLQRIGFQELLNSANGKRRKGGLTGWLGQYEDTGAMDRVSAAVSTPITTPGLEARQLQQGMSTPPGAQPPSAPSEQAQAYTPGDVGWTGPDPASRARNDVLGGFPGFGGRGEPSPLTEGMTGRDQAERQQYEAATQKGADTFGQFELSRDPRTNVGPPTVSPESSAPPPAPAPPAAVAPASSAWSAPVPGPAVGESHMPQLMVTPEQLAQREAQTEGMKERAKWQSQYDVLAGIYPKEEANRMFATHMTGTPPAQRLTPGPAFIVQESDPAGGPPITRRILSATTPDGRFVNALTLQPLPPGAEPALPGGSGVKTFVDQNGNVTKVNLDTNEAYMVGRGIGTPRTEPTPYTGGMTRGRTADGRDVYFRSTREGGVEEVPDYTPPPAADERPQTARDTLKFIDERAKQMVDAQMAGDPKNLNPLDPAVKARIPSLIARAKDQLALEARYPGYAALSRAALQGGGAPADDPSLPIGVRQYLTQMPDKHPNDPAGAKSEVATVAAKLKAEHPHLDFNRVSEFIDQLYASYGATPPAGPSAPGAAPQRGAARGAAPQAAAPVRLTRDQLARVATDQGISIKQAEDEARKRGYQIID